MIPAAPGVALIALTALIAVVAVASGAAADQVGSKDFIVRLLEDDGIIWDGDVTIKAGQSVRWHNEVSWLVASVLQEDQPGACEKSSKTLINLINFTASFSDAIVFRTPGTYYWFLDAHTDKLPVLPNDCIDGTIKVLGPPAPESSSGSVPSTTTVHFGDGGVLNQSVTISAGDSIQWQSDALGYVYQEDRPGQCVESLVDVTIEVNNAFVVNGVSNAIVFATPGIYYWFVTKSMRNDTIAPCTSSAEGAITVLPLSTTAVSDRGSQPASAAIAGAVVAAVIAVGLLASGAMIWIRRRRRAVKARDLGKDVGPVDMIEPLAAEVMGLETSVPYEPSKPVKLLPPTRVASMINSPVRLSGVSFSLSAVEEDPMGHLSTLLEHIGPAGEIPSVEDKIRLGVDDAGGSPMVERPLPVQASGGEDSTLGDLAAPPDVATWSSEDVAHWLEDKLQLRPTTAAM
ncbi:hypothetical protein HK101_000995 [Irineochytrium annulatum]|nr:hypothetical protein HK101_000995 [Irineochytrium annulatum]